MEHVEEAVALLETTRNRLDLARGLCALGEHCVSTTPDRARDLLGRALDLAETCTADRLRSTVSARLAELGVDVPAAPRQRASLTASERRIAELAADGVAFPEIAQSLFVTTRTVTTIVGSVSERLGAASPRELRTALDRLLRRLTRLKSTPSRSQAPAARVVERPGRDASTQRGEPTMTIESTAPTGSSPVEPSGKACRLRGLCAGAVHLPGDPGYDEARMPWNVAVDQRPAAVAYPACADEVSEIVRAAAASGLRVAPQGTGHNAGPLGRLDDVVLLRTSAMTGVHIDPARRIARVEAGVLWLDVVEAAAAHGLAALHGSSPDVGVVGYTLGGGIGWYARQLGMATNSVTAVELVLGDGTQVRADEDTNPDLFWAVRGGGGSFGVVTAMEFRLFDIDTAYAGMLLWDQEHAEKVLRAWAEWTVDAPDCVTTSFRMLNLPPMPELPEFLRGRTARGDRRRGARRRRDRHRDPGRPARPGAGDGHVRTGAGGRPGAAAHGPRGPDARRLGLHDPGRPAGRGDRGLPRPDRPRLGLDPARGRAPAARRGARPSARRARGRCPCSTASSCSSVSPSR